MTRRGDLSREPGSVVEIFSHCELFASLGQDDCAELVARCHVRDLAPDTLVIIDGDVGHEMYVLLDGVLEAFKDTSEGQVVLKRMDRPGEHTGEGALMPGSDYRRRASVRTVAPSRVLVVPEAVFRDAMALSPEVGDRLNVVHHRHARQLSMVEKSVMYRALVLFDQEQGWSRDEHFEPGDVVFDEGDPGDSVYLVRAGRVLIYRIEDGQELPLAVLAEGQTFGELAVLEGESRRAAARAEAPTDLVIIDRERFLEASSASPDLHDYLGTLKKVYALQGGVATVFDGAFRGDPAVVTVATLDDGREAIINHVVERDIYSASLEIPEDAKVEEYTFREPAREILRSLTIHDGSLVRVHAEGPWRELGEIHALLMKQAELDPAELRDFEDTGHLVESPDLAAATDPDAVLCQCLSLTRATIEETLARGAETLTELAEASGATTICGGCTSYLAEMVSSTGQLVELADEVEAAPSVRSFRFRSFASGSEPPAQPLRPALPGQHVVVSAEIGGAWVHRPYTITSPPHLTEWREITVKRENHGFLSSWLFRAPQDTRLKLSHPKGDFWIDPQVPATVVCLVAGIGMTPALALARSLEKADSRLKVHVDYSARTTRDFAYRDEFDALAEVNANFTVHYRVTGGRQHLDQAQVAALVKRFPGARFLICGPGSYQDDVRRYLAGAGVKPERIAIERFTPVGHAPEAAREARGIADRLQLWSTIALSAFYLVQALFELAPDWLVGIQEGDGYALTTGSLLLAYVAYQWTLPWLRLRGKLAQTGPHYRWHRWLGPLGPVLLLAHSASLGFGYTVVLPILFVVNAVVGALDKSVIRDPELAFSYQRLWLAIHVPLSCLVTVIMLIHLVYALGYR
ncbi:MAG: cyclic nucleotide-binding domain-containing protein [Xanthomonadales bacterium]|nr:cyclic nucleotide-binding domain-containing protein [Xanthomonadales bacterium]